MAYFAYICVYTLHSHLSTPHPESGESLSAPPSPALSPGLVYTNPAYSILRMIDGIFKSKSDHTQFFLFYHYLLSFSESLCFSVMNNCFSVVFPNDSINFIIFMCLTGIHEIKYSSPSKGIRKGSD